MSGRGCDGMAKNGREKIRSHFKKGAKVKVSQASGAQTAGAKEYVFDNAGRSAQARYRELSRLYDGNTFSYIKQQDFGRG